MQSFRLAERLLKPHETSPLRALKKFSPASLSTSCTVQGTITEEVVLVVSDQCSFITDRIRSMGEGNVFTAGVCLFTGADSPPPRYARIRSIGGRYVSYWNASLLNTYVLNQYNVINEHDFNANKWPPYW